jgi:2-dehydropantoate 2-reductase
VTVVARRETAEAIASGGLQVSSAALDDSFSVRPRVVSTLDEDVDVLLVAPKATALGPALSQVRSSPGLVVPLLNGLAHRVPLAARFGDSAVAGTIRVESERVAPGVIEQRSPGVRIELASGDPARRGSLDSLVSTLAAAGITAAVGESEAEVTWSKLCRLCPLALTTTAFDRPLGPIRDTPELADQLRAAVEEACAVAAAEGASIDPRDTLAELTEAHATLSSSMARDVAAGNEPELDSIAYAVTAVGARHSVPTPTIASLAAMVSERVSA